MSQLEILPSIAPVDFDFSATDTLSEPIVRSQEDSFSSSVIEGFLSSSPDYFRLYPDAAHSIGELNQTEGDIFVPSLPPLLRGHPDLHLRNGVINASRLATENIPDAEKAFFVADLSEVYKQHQRWARCLPGIEPFYGAVVAFFILCSC